jgi:hypothetical protein
MLNRDQARVGASVVAVASVICGSLALAAAPATAAPTCTVSSTAGSGAGSLTQALADLETSRGATCSRIEITATGTIPISAPLPVIHYGVEIAGPGQEALTLDGGKSRPVLVATLSGSAGLTVSGLTIAGGRAAVCSDCSRDFEPAGGALLVTTKPKGKSTGVVRIADAAFLDNRAPAGSGGAVLVDGLRLEIVNSRFVNNAAENGGAVYGGDVSVRGSLFSHDRATLGSGGAVYASRMTATGTTFFDSSAGESGGAITFDATLPPGITTSDFESNSAEGHGGGAIYSYPESGATIVIQDCTFTANSGSSGGGVLVEREWAVDDPRSASLLIGRSTFDSNTGGTGAGIYVEGIRTALLSNSTFIGNRATEAGGVSLLDVDATVQYVTMTGNTAAKTGGGIWARNSKVNISNSILWANTAPLGADLKDVSKRTILAADLFTSRAAVATKVGWIGAKGLILGVDPQLGPLADNGGPTQTMLPAATSPVIGKGAAKVSKPPKTDQRGKPRVIAGRADIGAVEVG